MKMKLTVIVDGEEYILKGTATKVEQLEDDYKYRTKAIKKAIGDLDEPKTLKRITDKVRTKHQMSMRLISKMLTMFDGKLWESSVYRNPLGGKPTKKYKLIKNKKEK